MPETSAPSPSPDLRSDSRRNRLRLVAAARELVAEKGVDVSAAEIAARAEVGVGTLYRRFGSKDALIRDILSDGIDEVQAVAVAALEDTDAWNGFATFFAFFSMTQVANQGIAEYVSVASGVPSEEMCQDNTRLRSLLQELVRQAHAEGTLRSDVTWEDIVILSRASVAAGECLGVHAPPEQWKRTCAIILEGVRSPGVAALPGTAPVDRSAGSVAQQLP
jgi:AcrR family transcriptional regulator